MKNKQKRLAQSGFMIFLLVIIAVFIIAVGFLISEKVNQIYGLPDDQLDRSQRIVYAIYLLFHGNDLQVSYGKERRNDLFIINLGDTGKDISSRLMGLRFIPDDKAFNIFLKYKGIDRRLQAGSYIIKPGMTPLEIADIIHDNDPQTVKFSFLPGWRIEEIAALVPTSGLNFSQEDFLDYVNFPPESILSGIPVKADNLEGLFFADSYTLSRDASAETVIAEFMNQLFLILPGDYEEKVNLQGLSLYEAIILASIIEKEAVVLREAPIIASVFLNRLKSDMPLQSDPTVQYALGYINAEQGWWKNPLATDDLLIDSPFNTYVYKGIPPSPICNPGLEALMAVANPEDSDYYFFRSSCDKSGLHIFSQTYAQHLEAACQ